MDEGGEVALLKDGDYLPVVLKELNLTTNVGRVPCVQGLSLGPYPVSSLIADANPPLVWVRGATLRRLFDLVEILASEAMLAVHRYQVVNRRPRGVLSKGNLPHGMGCLVYARPQKALWRNL